ncbi:MAG: alanine--tRNA ligase-related protein, partial [Anaerolineales bacterium]
LEVDGPLLALTTNGNLVQQATVGDEIEVLLSETCFYVEAGGQVADTGKISSLSKPGWEVSVTGMRKPAAGAIVHVGIVISGTPKTGDPILAQVDKTRRMDIMRNHTATHLLHHELRTVLGEHARQAGSLVAPDRLRFDFTHPSPVSTKELEQIETGVNRRLFESYMLNIAIKPL